MPTISPRFGRQSTPGEIARIKEIVASHSDQFPDAKVEDRYCYTRDFSDYKSKLAPYVDAYEAAQNRFVRAYRKVKLFWAATRFPIQDGMADIKDARRKIGKESGATRDVFDLYRTEDPPVKAADLVKNMQAGIARDKKDPAALVSGTQVFQVNKDTILVRNTFKVKAVKAFNNRSLLKRVWDIIVNLPSGIRLGLNLNQAGK